MGTTTKTRDPTTGQVLISKETITSEDTIHVEELATHTEKQGTNLNQRGVLYIASILLTIAATICGILSAVKAKASSEEDNSDWEKDADAALVFGSIAVVSAIVATPLAFCEARRFSPVGGLGLMITSWVLYGLGTLGAIGLVIAGFGDVEVHESAIVFQTLWNLVAWIFMVSYAEVALRK